MYRDIKLSDQIYPRDTNPDNRYSIGYVWSFYLNLNKIYMIWLKKY